MGLTKIGPKRQITIPEDAFRALRLDVGDVLEGRVDDGMLVLVPRERTKKAALPKLTPALRKLLTRAKRKIERIRRDLASARGLTPEEAQVAVRAGLIPRDQRWWWTEPWQRGEREAEGELRAGRTRAFDDVDDLIQDLRGR